jgi:hypothetical protein
MQPLLLVGRVLLKLLHSVAAHCHLKPQICTCIRILWHEDYLDTWFLDLKYFDKDYIEVFKHS